MVCKGANLPASKAFNVPSSVTVILNFFVLLAVEDLTIKPETGGRNFSSKSGSDYGDSK